jgi:selenide,water dikinase
MCEGSELSAEIEFKNVPRFDFLDEYLNQKSVPGGTNRNWSSYGKKINNITETQRSILADPQTSGGLLLSVNADKVTEFESFASANNLSLRSFGKLVPKKDLVIEVL